MKVRCLLAFAATAAAAPVESRSAFVRANGAALVPQEYEE